MPSIQPIVMPKLGLTMTEGLLAEWKVAPGDTVLAGDVIFVVETDKISNEIEASHDGIVSALHAAEGDVLPVGAVVMSLEVSGHREVSERHAAAAEPAAGEPPSPVAPPAARGAGVRIIATPLARRMAAQAGMDLGAIAGSGPRGRIMAEDVAAAQARADAVPSARTAAAGEQGAMEQLGAYQRVTARRLTEAKRDIPHFYIFAEADVTDLLALREQLNAGAPAEGAGHEKLTVNTFLVAAAARSLAAMPGMNRVWAGDALRVLPTVDVGIAVEGPKGLVAPVLRDLGTLTLDETAEAAGALIARARAGRLAPDDLDGGALAISNVGMFGATALVPIINPGQSSILGVGASQPLFRPDEQSRPVLRQILNLALSCDHRVIDGALAARFLQALCRQLEQPAALMRRPQREK